MHKFQSFPLSYDVADKPVLVIGEGAQALQKLRLLVRTTARLALFAVSAEAELTQFAAAHMIPISPREPTDQELTDASLVFVATGVLDADRRLAERARAAGTPVNVVDRPVLSDFATPAIVDRAPIAIAISTDGHAPVLSMKLRGAIEAMLSPQFGNLGAMAAEVRARARAIGRLPDAPARRGFWARLFDGPAAAAALAGDHERAVGLAMAELDVVSKTASVGTLFLIGAGPGDEDLLTLRAHRLLLSADVIAYDADLPERLVAMGRRDADRLPFSDPVARLEASLIELVRAGKRVALLIAGDPAAHTFAGMRNRGIEIEVVPGVAVPSPAFQKTALRKAA